MASRGNPDQSGRDPGARAQASPSPATPKLDGRTESGIQLSTFSDPNFDLKTFIDSITRRPLALARMQQQSSASAIPGSPRSPGTGSLGRAAGMAGASSLTPGFDPQPLIKALESAQADMIKFRSKIRREIDDLEDEVAAAEATRRRQASELDTQMEELTAKFDQLEQRISQVGTTAVRIGEQLETMDARRAKAVDERELITHYLEFTKGNGPAKLDAVRNAPSGSDSSGPGGGGGAGTSSSGLFRAASLAKRLRQMVHDMEGTSGEASTDSSEETARVAIDQYCETLESDVLRDFAAAAEKRDVDTMRHLSSVLTEFNGGDSCVRAWINNHPLFVTGTRGGVGPGGDPGDAVRAPSDPDEPDRGLLQLLEQLRATVYQDWEVVVVVFHQAPFQVLVSLVQRFFQQVIQQHMEQLLQACEQTSDIHYLRALAANHGAAYALAKDVSHFDTTVLKKMALQQQQQGGQQPIPRLAPVIEHCLEELFALYRNTTDREIAHLRQTCKLRFDEATTYYSQRKIQKKSMFSRMNRSIGALELKLSSETVVEVLAVHALSVARTVQLAQDASAEPVSKVFGALCDHLFGDYMDLAAEAVLEEIPQPGDGREPPDLKVLTTVQSLASLAHLLQAHFDAVVAPVVAVQAANHRETVEAKNARLQRVERTCATAVRHLLASAIAHVGVILTRQKRNDFRAREEDIADAQQVSATCTQLCEFLEAVRGDILKYLDGSNASTFLESLGSHTAHQLQDHFRKFAVTPTGALTLSRDVAHYCETLTKLQTQNTKAQLQGQGQESVKAEGARTPGLLWTSGLARRTELLRELATLFMVRPDHLSGVIDEGLLSGIDAQVLQTYLVNRADFKSAKIDMILRQRGGGGGPLSPTSGSPTQLPAAESDTMGSVNQFLGSMFSVRGM